MKRDYSAVLSCVGAVIGAGFASGREIVAFFTQYGSHAWWLIALAALTMTALCALCMRAVAENGCCENWCVMMHNRFLPQLCTIVLLVIIAGAMTAAAGHAAALLWNHKEAYLMGTVGTLLAACWISYGSLKPLKLLSAMLSMALLCALMGALIRIPQEKVVFASVIDVPALAWAALRSIGYACMNMMLAAGVVCRCGAQVQKTGGTAGMFGWIIGILMMISHYVYVRHPEVASSALPMVTLLSEYGRSGYLFGAFLLYLAVFTTLTSILYTLRTAVETHIQRWDLRALLVVVLPLTVSGMGFSKIVDYLYAPAGLVCLALVFFPLALEQWKKSREASFS